MTTAEAALIVSGIAGLAGLFGAVNSYRALAWQRRRDIDSRRVIVGVTCTQTVLVAGDHWVNVDIVNRSQQATIYVSYVTLSNLDGTIGIDVPLPAGHIVQKPGRNVMQLEPHAVARIEKRLTQENKEFLGEPFVAKVTLASDDVFRSEPAEFLQIEPDDFLDDSEESVSLQIDPDDFPDEFE